MTDWTRGGERRGVAALGAAYRSGETTPRAVAEAALARIAASEPELNAFADRMAEAALAEADRLGAALREGRDLGPLHGIPVAIKDLVEVAGAPTGWGTRAEPPRVAPADAPLVARLRAAGAVILGKTNCLEYAYGVAHPEVGQTNNPRDPSRTAGGSSGGSAAAVAAGIVPLAVGTDTGGSIRIPAAYCGIVGLKPTFGLVPLEGVFPLSPTLDHAGPLARSADDARLLLAALAGQAMEAEAPERPRLGLLRAHWPRSPAHRAVGAAVDAALARLEAAGFALRDIKIPGLDAANPALMAIVLPEAAEIHRDGLARNPGGYAPGTRAQVEAGLRHPASATIEALRTRERLRAAVDAGLTGLDALAAPAVPFVAPREDPAVAPGAPEEDDEMRASGWANLTGHPALALPCGSEGGLPVALQLAGARGGDARLLALAARAEGPLRAPSGLPAAHRVR